MNSDSSPFQRVNPYNKFLPYAESIDQDASNYLQEIKNNFRECLTRKPFDSNRTSVQIVNLHKYIALYGLRFSKQDHVYFIKVLYGLFTTPNLDPLILDQIAKVMITLLKKKYLLSRKDLILDWKPLFDLYYYFEDSSGALRGFVKGVLGLKAQIISVVKYSRSFFSDDATQEMLNRWRPMLCPFDQCITTAVKYFELFLPSTSDVPKERTYLLWMDEFMKLWEAFGNSPSWEIELFQLYARIAHHNIGRIDWQPYLEIFFSRIMAAFCLPVTYAHSGIKMKFGLSGSGAFSTISRWIVSAMGGKENSIQIYLNKMLLAIESYYYPANDCSASEGLHTFIALLCTYFVNRVHVERYNKKWKSKTPDAFKLTDDDITQFVESLLPIVFNILYNNYEDERKTIFNILATLRPALVIPPLLEKAFTAMETITEPHRLTACVAALSACSRPLVENYPMEVFRLLTDLVPGINVNDIWKSTDIFILLSDMLEMIWLVDFSDPSTRPPKISEEVEELLTKTSMFEDFVVSFTDQCLTLIENSSREQVRHDVDVMEECLSEEEIAADAAIADTFQKIMYKSSPKIFKLAFNKLRKYVEDRILEPCVAGTILAGMCKSSVAVQPQMALDFFIPHFCNKVFSILSDRATHPQKKTHQKTDQELQFSLLLLSEVISVRGLNFTVSPGEALLTHMEMLTKLLDATLFLEQKDEYEIAATLLQNLLTNLTHVRQSQVPTTYVEPKWSKEVYEWAKQGDLEKLTLEWYIPGPREILAANGLLERYLKPNLEALIRLSRGEQAMEKEEVMRRLRLVYKISHGSSEVLPALQAKPFTSCASNILQKFNKLYLTLEGKHVRKCIMEVLREVQKYLLAKSPDDTDSLSTIVTIYDVLTLSFGLDEDDLNDHMEEHRINKAHRLNRLVRSKRHFESVLIDRIMVQHETHIWLKNFLSLETLPEEVLNDIFVLATSRYSEVRTFAQDLLLKLLMRIAPESHELIVPKMLPLLQESPDGSHQHMKGVLYIITSEKLCFFYNWKLARQLMPALVKAQHSDKTSVVDLLKDVSYKCNRMYADFALFTLPVRKPIISEDFLKSIGLETNSTMEVDDSEKNSDFLALESELCQLVREGSLHWRHKQMALGMLFSIIVPDHIPPKEVVEMWLQCLIDDDRTIRLLAFQALDCILKISKKSRKKIEVSVDDIGKMTHERGSDNESSLGEHVLPGVRDDNLWLQYSSQMSEDEMAKYWEKPFPVKPSLGYYTWPKPMVKLHLTDDSTLQEPEYVRSQFLEFFTNPSKVEKFFHLNSLEHKKGEDQFSMDKGLFYSMLIECFGPEPILKICFPYMKKYAKSTQESEQRVVAELLYGIIRGSRFWSYKTVKSMWDEFVVLFKTILTNITEESIADWEICLSGATNKTDPNRICWLYELLLTEALQSLQSAQHGSFTESCYLRLLNKSILQNWKIRELYQRAFVALKDQLSHPYNKVRRRIAATLATLMSMDITYNGSWNFGSGFPQKKDFISQIVPKLNLNFHNPELNGFAKCNGASNSSAPSPAMVVDESSNSSSMDVDTSATTTSTTTQDDTESLNLLESVAVWFTQYVQVSSSTFIVDFYNLLPFFCQFIGNETNQDVSQSCLKALCFLSVCIIPPALISDVLGMTAKVVKSTSWKARMSILEFIQVFVFTNFMSMCNNAELVKMTEDIILGLIADDNLQVRQKAAKILGGLVHSKFLDSDAQQRLLQYFRSQIRLKMARAKKNRFQKVERGDDKLHLAKFHAGILGLCAFVDAYPYDVPRFVPDILFELERHLHDPQPIPKTIKNTFQEFKRTHMDNWSEHKLKFSEEQLTALTDLLVSPNYYA